MVIRQSRGGPGTRVDVDVDHVINRLARRVGAAQQVTAIGRVGGVNGSERGVRSAERLVRRAGLPRVAQIAALHGIVKRATAAPEVFRRPYDLSAWITTSDG